MDNDFVYSHVTTAGAEYLMMVYPDVYSNLEKHGVVKAGELLTHATADAMVSLFFTGKGRITRRITKIAAELITQKIREDPNYAYNIPNLYMDGTLSIDLSREAIKQLCKEIPNLEKWIEDHFYHNGYRQGYQENQDQGENTVEIKFKYTKNENPVIAEKAKQLLKAYQSMPEYVESCGKQGDAEP